jgi:hypothetical protein
LYSQELLKSTPLRQRLKCRSVQVTETKKLTLLPKPLRDATHWHLLSTLMQLRRDDSGSSLQMFYPTVLTSIPISVILNPFSHLRPVTLYPGPQFYPGYSSRLLLRSASYSRSPLRSGVLLSVFPTQTLRRFCAFPQSPSCKCLDMTSNPPSNASLHVFSNSPFTNNHVKLGATLTALPAASLNKQTVILFDFPS